MIEMLAGIFIVQITHGDLYDPCIIVLGCAIIMFSAELFHMGIKSNSLVTVYHKSKCTRSNCEMPLPCCLCHHSKILKDWIALCKAKWPAKVLCVPVYCVPHNRRVSWNSNPGKLYVTDAPQRILNIDWWKRLSQRAWREEAVKCRVKYSC